MIQNSQYLVHDTVILQGEGFVHKEQAETTCVRTADSTGITGTGEKLHYNSTIPEL